MKILKLGACGLVYGLYMAIVYIVGAFIGGKIGEVMADVM